MTSRDPVQRGADESRDLQDIAEWEPESLVDRLVYRLYALVVAFARGALVGLALLILAAQFLLGGFGALADPLVGLFVVLSVVPALVLAGYVRYADATPSEPLRLLVVTFVLGLLFAGFALVLNTVLGSILVGVLLQLEVVPSRSVVFALLFFLVVAPVEEAVKLLAVRLHAYRTPQFDAVIDGAVYGAAAGLGFATIENAMYIASVTAATGGDTLVTGGTVATLRALAGPGHVIYSAFAGYYLGLARFNREYAGPIVLKGLLIAIVLHGGYNTLVGHVPDFLATTFGISPFAGFFAFVIAYDGIFTAALIRKLSQYGAAYRETRPREGIDSELTEFDP